MKKTIPIYFVSFRGTTRFFPSATYRVQGNKVKNKETKSFSIVGPYCLLSVNGIRLKKEDVTYYDCGSFDSRAYTFRKSKRTSL